MGKQKKNGNKLAAQIAAEEAEEENFTLPAVNEPEEKPEKAQKTPVTYTAEQVQQMMKEAAAAAVAEAMKNLPQQQPQVVQVMADTEKVVLRWMAPVADVNVAVFGANGMYGQVTGKNGTVIVP